MIGWAGIFWNDNSKDENFYQKYLNKSIELRKIQQLNKNKNDDTDNLAILSLYTILSAAIICSEDVKEWYKHFKTLRKFLVEESNGNLRAIKKF